MAKTLGIIPARYKSSRIPGKPLADICGRPMLWWTYQKALEVKGLTDVICAVDDERVMEACKAYNMNAVMTNPEHSTHVHRVHEVAEAVPADFYAVICGDEPLTESAAVEQVLPKFDESGEYVVRSLMRNFDDPVEAYDSASMKVAVNSSNRCVFISRSIIPYPYKSVNYALKRLVGIECYNKKALDFFVSTPIGVLEAIESITLLRYLEHFIPVQLIHTTARQIGVDTPKNLEIVRNIIAGKK
ncbi:3-deoxy-manno-octulosonate cytidylyltransferase [Clostridia bacterium]|nr:3-deoxy-manno-octulosonate cytidylyltransferase [Clostridia bacterium]